MKLKTKFLAIALLIATVALGQGHERRGKNVSPEEAAQNRSETLKVKLKLTDAQYTQVYDQFLNEEKQIRAQREAMKKMREDHDSKMRSILTPDQYTQLKEYQAQRKEMMEKKRNQLDPSSDDSPSETK